MKNQTMIGGEVDIGEALEYMKRRAPKRYKVLQAMMQGKHDREIADLFGIDQAVVRTHISLICKDFGIQGKRRAKRTELMSKLSSYNYTDVKDCIVKRPQLESRLKGNLERGGSITRVESPRQMGKTTFVQRVIDTMNLEHYEVIQLNMKLLLHPDYDTFLRSFSSIVAKHLDLENQLDEYWSEGIASNYNISDYFAKYLLTKVQKPLILVLDNVDEIFNESDFLGNFDWKSDFCWLIKGWYDSAQDKIDEHNVWRKLRFVLISCTDVYAGLDLTKSPLTGIGEMIEIPEFTPPEVQKLAKFYNLKWQEEEVEKLMAFAGGHPFLINTLLDKISSEHVNILEVSEEELSAKFTPEFDSYLSQYASMLREFPQVKTTYSKLVDSYPKAKDIKDPKVIFKLESLGLVKKEGNGWTARCKLYRDYFTAKLNKKELAAV